MEYLSIYDENGNPTEKYIKRGDPIKKGERIAVAVIFIENDNKFLIQKTSPEKGGEYSSTGGHINKGETPKEAILREAEEELGVSLNKDLVESYGYLKDDQVFRFLFYTKEYIPIELVTLQTEEVEDISYKTKEEIEELINNKEFLKSHGDLFHYLLENKK